MNQCHECGNELTELDAFCPFCGIALAPVVVPEETADTPDEPDSGELSNDESVGEEPSENENEFVDLETALKADESEHDDIAAPSGTDVADDDSDGFIDSSVLSSESDNSLDEPEGKTENEGESADMDGGEQTYAAADMEIPDPVANESESEDRVTGEAEQSIEESSEIIQEDPIDEGPGFLEDSTVIMPSFPDVSDAIAAKESNQETESEGQQVGSESTEPEAEGPDIADAGGSSDDVVTGSGPDPEGETVIVKSGSLDLPPLQSSETPLDEPKQSGTGAEDNVDEDELSKTIGYVPSDFEELKHIDAAALEAGEKEQAETEPENELEKTANPEVKQTDDSNQTETSSELPPEPVSNIDDTREATPEEFGIAASDDVRDVQSSASSTEPSAAVPAHSDTTPNIGVEDTDGSNKKKLKPLDEGTVLNNRYEIVRKIGGGGMGAVYLANDKNLGGVLRAVKEMVQSYIEEEQQEKAINDFKRESMLLTSLEHPSIPTIYDYFYDETEGRFYLVMKYISGGDLSGKIRSAPEGKLDEKSVVEWGSQIADVLDYLHNRQPPIVYRDLKPANVMVDGNSGRVMLIDFGIARWVNKEEKGVTAVGTMGYAPPELFSGNVEPRSDIYSLGSTMFHLLTGADPQSNPLLIFDFQKHPRPRQINSALSDQIEQILMRAVEYNAEKRFESAAEMRDALLSHLDRLKSGSASYGIDESPKAVGLAEQPVFCGFCGQKIVATDMFCAFCGAKQPLAQPGVHAEEYAPAGLTAKLLVEGTSDLDAPAFSLVKDDNLLGRRDPISDIFPEVDLSKFDPQTKISRKHARIWRDGDKFMLEDLNSSNGTVLKSPRSDSVRLAPHQSHVLANGDKIQMGDTVLHFLVG
ncbi:MAG: protein kinase [Pyrinomonadaceae bacterium]